MTQGRKIPDELVSKWVAILPSLQKKYPPKHSGYRNSYNHVSCALAQKHNLHPKTVYDRLKPALKKRMVRNGYCSKHERLRHHIDHVLAEVYNGDFELPLREVVGRINDFSGINMRESSLETLLNRYESHPKGKPLLKTVDDTYVLNGEYYANKKVRAGSSPFQILSRIKY